MNQAGDNIVWRIHLSTCNLATADVLKGGFGQRSGGFTGLPVLQTCAQWAQIIETDLQKLSTTCFFQSRMLEYSGNPVRHLLFAYGWKKMVLCHKKQITASFLAQVYTRFNSFTKGPSVVHNSLLSSVAFMHIKRSKYKKSLSEQTPSVQPAQTRTTPSWTSPQCRFWFVCGFGLAWRLLVEIKTFLNTLLT